MIKEVNCDSNPLISIVIPSYNHGKYIGRALESLIYQSYGNWEAVVVDNYSTDETDEIVGKFRDIRIRYLKINNNGVIAISRNLGIKSSNGIYIAFLDADDWWKKNKLSIVVNALINGADIVYHDLEVVGEKFIFGRRKLIGSWQVKAPILIELLLKGNALATSSVVVRRDIIERVNGFDESPAMVACEDYNLWMKIAAITEKFKFINVPLGYYLDHELGQSKRDTSLAEKAATSVFLHQLDDAQIKYLKARIKYINLRFLYRTKDFEAFVRNCNNCWESGSVLNRIKTVCMYLISILRIHI